MESGGCSGPGDASESGGEKEETNAGKVAGHGHFGHATVGEMTRQTEDPEGEDPDSESDGFLTNTDPRCHECDKICARAPECGGLRNPSLSDGLAIAV